MGWHPLVKFGWQMAAGGAEEGDRRFAAASTHEESPYAGESPVLFNARRMSSFIG